FKRNFGSYLSENQFGSYRYLAYAVEHYFINGGSRAYIMRVAPSDAKAAAGTAGPLTLTALNPGAWGNDLQASLTPSSKAKTQIYEAVGETKYRVKNGSGFNAGDVVAFEASGEKQYSRVVSSRDNVIELSSALEGDVVDNGLLPTKL